jgi:predicted RNA-binding Zn-ribbon protein involved in translation (DUF1610 family)
MTDNKTETYEDPNVGEIEIETLPDGRQIAKLKKYNVSSLAIAPDLIKEWLENTITEYTFYDEEIEATPACLMCGGETYPIGGLGSISYFRCRNCGQQVGRKN